MEGANGTPPHDYSYGFVTTVYTRLSSNCNTAIRARSVRMWYAKGPETSEPRRGGRGWLVLAESVGFEPTDRCDTINALAGRPIRPLWQLSGGNSTPLLQLLRARNRRCDGRRAP